MANIYDTRSTTGDYLRGKTVYGGGARSSPNPTGRNANTALANAARLKRKRRAQQGYMKEPTVSNSMLTDRGGNTA
jgi:hypothetical protein